MLVLSRKAGESLVIGDDVKITVTKLSGNRVTIAIDAPRSVSIVRGELDRHESAERPVSKRTISFDPERLDPEQEKSRPGKPDPFRMTKHEQGRTSFAVQLDGESTRVC